jgi:alpha-L-glutamate ligase-like protein
MPIKPSHILGTNGRYPFTKLNASAAKAYGFSKLKTKQLLAEHDIPTAKILHVFESVADLEAIQWETIPTPFVIKPASGSAGKGIVVIKKKLPDQKIWKNHDGESLTDADLNLHVSNILDGEYSTWGSQHKALIEEMVVPHPAIGKYSYRGTPDIRVIVFNSIPVMAMARIPTKESKGRANLDQGAIGLGIDMGTGVTTFGIKGKSQRIIHFPGTKKKVNGVLIPQWRKLLETAVKAANAAGYKYMGADLFIDKDKGPMIVELNGFPGLSIQLCNRAGLKRRLERVEDLEVRDPKHGVKISQALFGEIFVDKLKAEEGLQIISTHPTVTILGEEKLKTTTEAFVNTGRYRSAIAEELADELGLIDIEDLLWQQQVTGEGRLPVVEVSFKLREHLIKTAMIVTKRLNRTKHKVELGRRDTQQFLIGEVGE